MAAFYSGHQFVNKQVVCIIRARTRFWVAQRFSAAMKPLFTSTALAAEVKLCVAKESFKICSARSRVI
jgi:hypothetical protein